MVMSGSQRTSFLMRVSPVALWACAFGVTVLSTVPSRADWDPPAIVDFPQHHDFVGETVDVNSLLEIGERLFVAKFNVHDGAGRPAATGDSKPTIRFPENGTAFSRIAGPDAMACSSCHNDPIVGGSGDFVTNVFVGAHLTDPPTLSTKAEITAERNTTTIMGAGLIELLAREITAELHQQRNTARLKAFLDQQPTQVQLEAKGIDFGTITVLPNGSTVVDDELPIDYDLVIRPFGVKGVAASLREFTIFALNQHHGIQALERFGWERTGLHDFDLDGVEKEFSIGQVTAMVAFQAALPPPVQQFSDDPARFELEALGQQKFHEIGCSQCHRANLVLNTGNFTEPGPYNRPGAASPDDLGGVVSISLFDAKDETMLISPYTDFRRHNLCDSQINHFCNEVIKQDNVPSNLFLTAKLWDLASSAPYGHRGDLTTISEAILVHGGEARAQRDRFLALSDHEKFALIGFLRTLGRSRPASR